MNARYGLAIQVSSSCAVKLMQHGPGGVVRLAARSDALHHTACLTLNSSSRVRITDFCSLVSLLDAFDGNAGWKVASRSLTLT